MLIAYIANHDIYSDCVLTNDYGERNLQDEKDLENAVREWLSYEVGIININDNYEDGETIVTINVLNTEKNTLKVRKIKAIKQPSFIIV